MTIVDPHSRILKLKLGPMVRDSSGLSAKLSVVDLQDFQLFDWLQSPATGLDRKTATAGRGCWSWSGSQDPGSRLRLTLHRHFLCYLGT